MRILLCKSHFAGPVSGSDETLVSYATNLKKQGHQLVVVLLYAPAENDQYYARLKQAGVEVIAIASHPFLHNLLTRLRASAFWLAAFLRLPVEPLRAGRNLWQQISYALAHVYLKHCRSFFRQCRADLLHVMTPDPGAAVMIRAAAEAGIPVLYQELGTPHYLPALETPYKNFSKVVPLCSQMAALSPRLAKQWQEKLLLSNPISVLPLLVEDGVYVEGPDSSPSANVTFGFAARLEKGKGPLVLVDAFARVRSELSNTSLQIAGVGPEEHDVRMRVEELGLEACQLRGAYKSPQERNAFMKRVDVFVLPTLAEGTPNSIIEAMAHGLPVIASEVGGVPDLLTHESGILVPPGDPKALAKAMKLLASDHQLRWRMGREARARYEKLFSPEAVVPMLMHTYERTATRRANGNGHHQSLAHPWTEMAREVSECESVLKGQRVIFVLGNLELGGAERQALLLARHLAEHELARVEVWGFNTSGPVADICERHGIRRRVVSYPFAAGPLRRMLSLMKLAWLFRRARPDLLLPYTTVPNVACALIWQLTGARDCVWNQRDEGLVPLKKWWERWAVRRVSRFVTNSHAGARFLTHELNVSPANVRVIQNGISEGAPASGRRAWRERLGIDAGAFVACMVANLHSNKDHKTLLKAWREVVTDLKASGRSAVLVLAGRHDDAYQSLRALAYELEIDRAVRFAGHVDDVAGLLGAVDVGVFSSRSEGCPNGVLECMAAGLAVAGTNIDGVRDVVGLRSAQFLAPPGDFSALAQVILKLAGDPVLCSTIGAENRTRIREHYDSQRMCEDTVACLTAQR